MRLHSVIMLALAAFCLPTSARSQAVDPYLAEDLPDVAFSGNAASVQALADSLDHDAVRIYEFVRNELEYQPYYGLMKGPVATLESRAGNDYDLAALLVSLYRASGIPARFARGRIEVRGPEASAWTGTESLTGEHAKNLWTSIEPPHWTDPGNSAIGSAYGASNGGFVQKTHIWVEAQVPMARYRGTGAAGGTGNVWLALDPSYKLRDWKPDPALPIGTPALTFDYDGPNGYYRSLNERLPSEVFEEQVARWLALNRPGISVADAMYWGPVRDERPGVLPNALPYAVTSATRHSSLIALHCYSATPDPNCINTVPAAGDSGYIEYRHEWQLTLSPGGEQWGWTAALQGHRLSLIFPPTPGDVGDVPERGYGALNCTGPIGSIRTQPMLSIDGVTVYQFGSTPDLCAAVTATVENIVPNPGGPPGESLHTVGTYSIKAGGTYLLAVDAFAASSEGTQRVADALRAAHEAYPVLSNSTAPYVDLDHDEMKDTNEPFLGRDFVTQEKLIGGLLHLASARYFEDRVHSARKLDGLHQRLRSPSASSGLIQSAPAVEYLLGLPFTVRAPDLVIDLQAMTTKLRTRTGQKLDTVLWPTGRETHHDYLRGNEESALEHVVWEEIAGLEAVSTVRGLQLQLSMTDLDLLKIRSNAEGTSTLHNYCRPAPNGLNATVVRALPGHPDFGLGWRGQTFGNLGSPTAQISVCEDRSATAVETPAECILTVTKANIYQVRSDHCQALDRTTHCILSQGPLTYDNGVGYCSALSIPQQSTLDTVSELWITRRSLFRFDSFSGFVYYKRWKNGDSVFAIQPTSSTRPYGGGIALRNFDDEFLMDPWSLTEDLLYGGDPIPQNFVDYYLGTDHLPFALMLNPSLRSFGLTLDEVFDDVFTFPTSSVTTDYVSISNQTFDFDSILLNNHETPAGDPVSVVTGAFFMNEIDLRIAGPGGLDIRMVRSYDSRLDYNGPLGHGWIHTYDQHLRFDAGDAADAKDDRLIWITEAATERPYQLSPDGTPVALPGVYDTLEAEGSGYVLRLKAGGRLHFGTRDAANRSSLLSIEDRNGNRVWCRYNASNRLTSVDFGSPSNAVSFSYDAAGRVDRVEDWTGRRWEYFINAAGDLESYTDPAQVALGASGRAWQFEYDTSLDPSLNHNLSRWVRPADRDVPADGQGDVWMRFAYYADDTVMKHESSIGDVTWFAYNRFRKRTTMSHPDGTRQVYVYDRWGNVVRYENENGVATTYEYDGPRRAMIAEIDELGFRAEVEHDLQGNVVRREDRLGKSETWAYNSLGQPTSHVDKRGNEQRFEYDANGNLLREFAALDGQLQLLRSHIYDARGNPTATTEFASLGGGNPATTRMEYQANGIAVRRIIDALGHSVQIESDPLNRPHWLRTIRTRASGAGPVQEAIATRVEYDALDRPFQRVGPTGTATESSYDANGLVRQERTIPPAPAPARVDVEYRYDDFDRRVAVDRFPRPGELETTEFEYDSKGRVTRIISPLGSEERRVYDGVGRLTESIDASEARRAFIYDAVGRQVDAIDPEGRENRTEYDAEGRVVRTWLEFDGTTTSLKPFNGNGSVDQRLAGEFEYDDSGNLQVVTDAKGHTTTTTYDDLNRPIRVTGPEGPDLPASGASVTTSAYDLAGRLALRTEKMAADSPATRTRRIHYDALGRVDSMIDPLGRVSTAKYDEIGNLVESVNGEGEKLQYRHDPRGLLLARAGPLVSDEFGYDAFGRQTLARNSTSTRAIQYDGLNRAIEIDDSQFGRARRVFDADGRLVSVVYPDDASSGFPAGVVVNYGYDRRGLLTTVSDPVAGVWRSAYDSTGRMTSERLPGGIERAFDYRPEGWLDRVEVRRGGTVLETFAYDSYDELGNAQLLNSGEGTTHVGYDARSRVTSATYREGTQRQTSETFGYDLVGNRTAHSRDGQGVTFQVDAADQLNAILNSSDQVLESFTHDGAGRRKTHAVGGQTTTYGYDAIGRLRTVAPAGQAATGLEYDALGARYRRTVGGVETASYLDEWIERRNGEVRRLVHGGGIDQVLAEVTGGAQPESFELVRDGAGHIARVDDGVNPTQSAITPWLVNGSFEGAAKSGVPSAWEVTPIAAALGTWTHDRDTSYGTGHGSMRLDISDPVYHPDSDPSSTINLQLRTPLEATPTGGTRRFRVSACMRKENLQGQGLQVRALGYLPDGTQVGGNIGSVVSSGTGTSAGWTCAPSGLTLDLSAYPTARVQITARVREMPSDPTRGGTVWVDNVQLFEVTASNQLPAGFSASADVGEPPAEWSRRYTAYGEDRGSPEFYGVERSYTGRPIEGDTGLLYLRARHYDPATGRFLQADPLGLGSDQLYAYAANNPYRYRDPFGLRPQAPGGVDSLGLRSLAMLSKRPYGEGLIPASYNQLRGTDARVPPELLYNEASGFNAEIFRHAISGTIIVAFAGTDQWRDLPANAGQALGRDTQQYTRANALALAVRAKFSEDVVFVGHSLGGGLASLGAIATGSHAYTFNSAGLSDRMSETFGLADANSDALISAYFLVGDALSFVQDLTPLPNALGDRHFIFPRSLHTPIGYHFVDTMIESLPESR